MLRAGRLSVIRQRNQGFGKDDPGQWNRTRLPHPDFRIRRAQPESLKCGFDRGVRGAAAVRPSGLLKAEPFKAVENRLSKQYKSQASLPIWIRFAAFRSPNPGDGMESVPVQAPAAGHFKTADGRVGSPALIA